MKTTASSNPSLNGAQVSPNDPHLLYLTEKERGTVHASAYRQGYDDGTRDERRAWWWMIAYVVGLSAIVGGLGYLAWRAL